MWGDVGYLISPSISQPSRQNWRVAIVNHNYIQRSILSTFQRSLRPSGT